MGSDVSLDRKWYDVPDNAIFFVPNIGKAATNWMCKESDCGGSPPSTTTAKPSTATTTTPTTKAKLQGLDPTASPNTNTGRYYSEFCIWRTMKGVNQCVPGGVEGETKHIDCTAKADIDRGVCGIDTCSKVQNYLDNNKDHTTRMWLNGQKIAIREDDGSYTTNCTYTAASSGKSLIASVAAS